MVQRAILIAALCGVAFVLSGGAVRAFVLLGQRRFVAQPGARSSHSRPTPTGGGFPALLVFLFVAGMAVLLGIIPSGPRWSAIVLCVGALGLLGLFDDAYDIRRSGRLLTQALIAAVIVRWVGHPGPTEGAPGLGAFAASVVGFAGLVNAFNFMDGIDALVGGTGVVLLGFLAWFTRDPVWLILAASYCGFLIFNIPPARVFMGDAGSTALGGLVGIALLSGRASLEAKHLIIFGPLLGDSIYTIARRLIRKENIFMAHHSHLYQRLLRAGHSHTAISGCYAAATFVLGLLVVLVGRGGAAAGLVGCLSGLIAIETHLTRRHVPFSRDALRSVTP